MDIVKKLLPLLLDEHEWVRNKAISTFENILFVFSLEDMTLILKISKELHSTLNIIKESQRDYMLEAIKTCDYFLEPRK